ncbi:MAG: hypothetical protein FWD41_04690 [Actinomycetia bacterium]|nr:hypothetical protein [Actinomycetes bacterium]
MSKRLMISLVLALVGIAVFSAAAFAAGTIEFQALGTAAPPASLGGFPLTQVADPGFEEDEPVEILPTFAGDIVFTTTGESSVAAYFVPDGGWNSWSHGYEGLVFMVYGDSVTLTLPENIKAFVVYVEPNSGVHDISVQANDGMIYTEEISADAGAAGFGFYATGDLTIETITITAPEQSEGFAFGEIGLYQEDEPPTPSDTVDVEINIEKIVRGNPAVMPEFNFVMAGYDDEGGDYAAGTERWASITGPGKLSFILENLGVGEYVYLIGEVNFDNPAGWVFDDEIWFVIVEVYENGTYDVGYISMTDLEILVDNLTDVDELTAASLENHTGAIFVNSYTGSSVPPTGDHTAILSWVTLLSMAIPLTGLVASYRRKEHRTR